MDASNSPSAFQATYIPDPRSPLPAWTHRSIPEAFDAHADRVGSALAVADATVAWTYGELKAKANQLAHALRARGVGPGDVVAVHAARNARTVLSILAVMKTGAAFAILDARYPTAWLETQLAIVKPKALLKTGDEPLPAGLASSSATPELRIDLATRSAELDALPTSSPDVPLPANLAAYVTFTSGTTGGPRAIVGAHGAIAHFVDWQATTFGIKPDDRFSALSGVAHDPFLRDVLSPLSCGASVHLPADELRSEPDLLTAWLADQRISVVHLTPSSGEVLAVARSTPGSEARLPAVRYFFFGGETLRGELLVRLHAMAPKSTFVNFYGATETPQAMSYFVASEPAPGVVPIGRGIRGVQLLVLDDKGEVAAVGSEGEICVRTKHLAIGYLDKTPGGFGTNPFTGDPEDRIYRTGDRGSYLADGSVMHRGRNDDQVKVRGYRIELLEVETAMRAHPGVQQAAAVVRADGGSLDAYVVGDADVGELTRALRDRLPPYMVPAAVFRLASFPLTANGKVDRRALVTQAPIVTESAPEADGGAENEIEATIMAIWQDVLEADAVGRHDNFFDLGGHSLNATGVATRLRDAFSIDLAVRTIFESPTVAELAERIVDLVLQAAPKDALASAMDGLGDDMPSSSKR